MYNNYKEFGWRIASLRKEKGYTQEKISSMLNVTPQAVSKWEQGNALPDTMLLPLLAKLLNVSIDYLLTGESLAGKAGPYDREYQKEAFYWGIRPSELAEQIVDILQCDTANKRLLDIGSGEGRDAVYFATLPNAVFKWMRWRFLIQVRKKLSNTAGCRVMRLMFSMPI